jgi:predicted lysophospholipase L1 biosynthesis ABC-type transport system permease subunit
MICRSCDKCQERVPDASFMALLFSAIVQERYREVGLLRAMGARPNQIMTIIVAESAIVTGLGGVAGCPSSARSAHVSILRLPPYQLQTWTGW